MLNNVTQQFPATRLPVGYYTSREERAQFIAVNFSPYLSSSVLDVGCGEAFLRRYVTHYIGIDLVGNPDLIVNLEHGELPFKAEAFDAVVCTDVLEHVESFSKLLAELFRVARRSVIIGLPNMYALGYRLKFLRGQAISKRYSLAARDRHKWLFSLAEARSFLQTSLPPDWDLAWEFGYYPRAWWRVGFFYKLLSRAYPNLLATAYWALFEHRLL